MEPQTLPDYEKKDFFSFPSSLIILPNSDVYMCLCVCVYLPKHLHLVRMLAKLPPYLLREGRPFVAEFGVLDPTGIPPLA